MERLRTIAAIIGASSFAAIVQLSGSQDKLAALHVTAICLLASTLPLAAAFYFRPPAANATLGGFCGNPVGALYAIMAGAFVVGLLLFLISFAPMVGIVFAGSLVASLIVLSKTP